MRLTVTALGLLLPVAAILSGCGVGPGAAPLSVTSPPASIQGKAFGGQQPVANSVIGLYSFGSTGYGSTGTLLASTITDSGGYFNIDPSSINCPTPSTPVYILSMGGNPGFGNNKAVTLGSSLGACSDASTAFVTVNEVSTAMLAYTFSHFFSSANSTGDVITPDHFGAPADRTSVISNTYGMTFGLLDVENGYPRVNTSTTKFEGAKLISLGNVLGACVNSVGPSSPSCSALFLYTTVNGTKPSNTLEAAINVALNPTQNVPYVFALQPQSGAAAFTGGLTASPADWTLSASFTSPNFGLAVNTRTASTIDIDREGRVWFPSNGPSNAGVGYFDPSTVSFSSLFPGGVQHPQQVAIDIDDYVWANDMSSSNIAGFAAAAPSSPVTLSLPGTTSTSLTVAYDNTLRYGIVAPDGLPALAEVSGKNTYFQVPNTEIQGGYGFIASSLAGDVIGGFGIGGQELSTPTTYDLYFAPNGTATPITYQTFQDAGQVVFTGNNFIGTRGGYSAGEDGICIWNAQNCFSMADTTSTRHPSGLSLDGAGALWLADQNGYTVEEIPLSNGSYLNGSNQANNLVYLHNASNGGTVVTPAGIAVDGAGNVWVSNSGCYGNGCTPGSFTLSELIGAGTPTITPVALQVVVNDTAGTEPQKKTASSAK